MSSEDRPRGELIGQKRERSPPSAQSKPLSLSEDRGPGPSVKARATRQHSPAPSSQERIQRLAQHQDTGVSPGPQIPAGKARSPPAQRRSPAPGSSKQGLSSDRPVANEAQARQMTPATEQRAKKVSSQQQLSSMINQVSQHVSNPRERANLLGGILKSLERYPGDTGEGDDLLCAQMRDLMLKIQTETDEANIWEGTARDPKTNRFRHDHIEHLLRHEIEASSRLTKFQKHLQLINGVQNMHPHTDSMSQINQRLRLCIQVEQELLKHIETQPGAEGERGERPVARPQVSGAVAASGGRDAADTRSRGQPTQGARGGSAGYGAGSNGPKTPGSRDRSKEHVGEGAVPGGNLLVPQRNGPARNTPAGSFHGSVSGGAAADGDETQRDGPQPGGSQSGAHQRRGFQRGASQPGASQPGGSQPGGSQPGGSQPGGSQPGGSQSGGSQSGGSQPGGSQSGGSQSGGSQSGGSQSGGSQSGGSQSGAHRRGGFQRGASQHTASGGQTTSSSTDNPAVDSQRR